MAQDLQAEIARCDAEIESAKAQVRAGNRDLQGLCLAIRDWSAEKRLIEDETPAKKGVKSVS